MNILKVITFSIVLLLLCSCNEGEKNIDLQDSVTQNRSNKRGVSFEFQLQSDVESLAQGISWSYNWGPDQDTLFDSSFSKNQLDFVPMTWNGNFSASRIRNYKKNHPQCKYLLAFNEPNLRDQANLTPIQAANNWPAVKSLATELGLKIISPAMNYGNLDNYGDPIKWLDDFFSLIPIADIDGIAIHCYMSSAYSLKEYISRFKKYGKPIWVTEFCAWDQSVRNVTDQMKFMSNVINYMESDLDIARYAWFIPRGGNDVDAYPFMYLLTKSKPFALTPLGEVFVNMSSQDKSIYYSVNQQIEAEHYNSICIAEGNGTTNWVDGPTLQPTTDKDGKLELCNFFVDQWVEYQINVPQSDTYSVEIRYASYLNSKINILIDKVLFANIELPSTSEEDIWNTALKSIYINKGKQTLRFKLSAGRVCINWLKINKENPNN